MKISQTVFNLQSWYMYMVEMAMFNVQRTMTPKVGNQSYDSWNLLIVFWSFKFVWSFIKISETFLNLQSRHQYMIQMAIFNIYNVLCSKGHYSKGRLTSYGSCVLHIVSWCFTFVWNFTKWSQTVFNLKSGHEYMVEMAMFNVQRAILP